VLPLEEEKTGREGRMGVRKKRREKASDDEVEGSANELARSNALTILQEALVQG